MDALMQYVSGMFGSAWPLVWTLAKIVANELPRWAKLAKDANINAD